MSFSGIKNTKGALVGLLTAIILISLACSNETASEQAGISETGAGSVKREQAPDIRVEIEGGEFQLSDYRGKVVVLYFSFPG